MWQSSKLSATVEAPFCPSLCIGLPAAKPASPWVVDEEGRNALPPSAGSTVANSTMTSATSPFEMKILLPLIR